MSLAAGQNPPYVSHRTFTTFLESLQRGIPDRVDGSVFDSSFSGTSRKQVVSALKALNLIDDDLRPNDRLMALVTAQGAERREVWRTLLEEAYAPLFRLDLEIATPYQLRDQLRKIVSTESMLVKCESFFKHAATEAGIKLSPHIMRRKHSPRRKRPEPRNAPRDDATMPGQTESAAASNGDAAASGDVELVAARAGADGTAAAPVMLREMDVIAEKLLEKIPEFNPNWTERERDNWFNGIERLTAMMAVGVPRPTQPSPSSTGTSNGAAS